MLAKIKALIIGQPAVIISFVGASIGLATAFGLDLSASKEAGIMAFITIGLGFITRLFVSPSSTVVAQVIDGEVVAGHAHPLPDGTPVTVITSADLVK